MSEPMNTYIALAHQPLSLNNAAAYAGVPGVNHLSYVVDERRGRCVSRLKSAGYLKTPRP